MSEQNKILSWCFKIIDNHASTISNLGLIDGKMGIALAIYNAQSEALNQKIISIGEGFIEDICKNVKDNLSLNFSDGLGGIGWGFEYGFQQDFFEGNSDEFLMEIDRKFILSLVYKKPNSLNLFDGILGYCYYFLNRLQGINSNEENFTTITCMHCLKLSLQQLELILNQLDYTINELEEFSVFWDLPIVFILLSECIEKKYFVNQATEILEKLIEKNQEKPQLKISSKLILSLTFKYYELKSKTTMEDKIDYSSIFNVVEVKKELDGKYSLNGASGIALLYYKIFKINKEVKFKHCALLFLQFAENELQKNKDNYEIDQKPILNQLGLSDGVSGFIYAQSIINKNE